MSERLVHVLFSPSGAGTLRTVLSGQGRTDLVACPFDNFSFGPIAGDDAARITWVEEAIGVSDWESVVANTAPFLEASCAIDAMPVAWISRRDTQSYAGFLWWLSRLGDAPCSLVDVTELMIAKDPHDPLSAMWPAISPSVLLPDDMARLLGSQVSLDPAERQAHRARWHRLVAENAPFRIIDRQGELVSAPISHFDPLLLACASAEWRKMARIVAEALVRFRNEGISQAGDLVLYGRICALAEVGALEWRGDLSTMQGCELRLPTHA